jgi:MFS family permease
MRPSLVRWRILGLIVAISLVSYLLRGNLSIAAPTMMANLQLSEIQWGWVMAAFPLGYALFQFPGGVWGGRVGPRKALMLIALAWAALVALTGADSLDRRWRSSGLILVSLVCVQFLVGVAHAPVFPVRGGEHRALVSGGRLGAAEWIDQQRPDHRPGASQPQPCPG